MYWVDRTSGLTTALSTQTFPFAVADQVALWERFERAVYAAFVTR
ncbi:hypothetical protein ABZU76_17850 [Amycolatopsis sp. NPDC005232]